VDDKTRRELAEIAAQEAELAERKRRLIDRLKAQVADDIGLVGRERAAFIGLQPITKSAKVSSDMVASHRIALSQSRNRKSADPFLPAIRARGYTLRSLATALDVSQPTLSAHRKPKGHANSRPIPRERAGRIASLTGWPADARHWPAGIS